jgi:endoglucanase
LAIGAVATAAFSQQPQSHTAASGADALATIRRGVNILGYDGVWKGERDAPFRLSEFRTIHEAGFDHVRINFFGFHFMDARDQVNAAVLERLDYVLDVAATNNLAVVLDQHDSGMCQSTPQDCKQKLVAFWRQITTRYARSRPRVIFEILNEPGGQMSHAEWNATLAAAIEAVRAVDPNRTLIVAALNKGDPRDIEKLEIPANDPNLIITVHYYEPMRFTHQGAPWLPEYAALHDVAWGAEDSRRKVDADLTIAARWANEHGRPGYLGEFGVYDTAPTLSRMAWMRYVARAAERFGWGWAYWQYDHDFSLLDNASRTWKQPLLDALIETRKAK